MTSGVRRDLLQILGGLAFSVAVWRAVMGWHRDSDYAVAQVAVLLVVLLAAGFVSQLRGWRWAGRGLVWGLALVFSVDVESGPTTDEPSEDEGLWVLTTVLILLVGPAVLGMMRAVLRRWTNLRGLRATTPGRGSTQ